MQKLLSQQSFIPCSFDVNALTVLSRQIFASELNLSLISPEILFPLAPEMAKIMFLQQSPPPILGPNIVADLILAAPNTHDSSFLGITFLIPVAGPLAMVYRMTILYAHPSALTAAPSPPLHVGRPFCSTNAAIFSALRSPALSRIRYS